MYPFYVWFIVPAEITSTLHCQTFILFNSFEAALLSVENNLNKKDTFDTVLTAIKWSLYYICTASNELEQKETFTVAKYAKTKAMLYEYLMMFSNLIFHRHSRELCMLLYL